MSFGRLQRLTSNWGARLELRWRLSLVIGLLLTATLGLSAMVAVNRTREAVQHELSASLHTATSGLDLTLRLLRDQTPADVEAALQLWSAAYAGARHLCVSMDAATQAAQRCLIPAAVPGVPGWFVRGATAREPAVLREVLSGDRALRIQLVSDPRDELLEAWSDVRGLLLLMGLLAFSVNLCVFLTVSLGLQPLRRLMAAMEQIGRGEGPSALPQAGAPELRLLADGLRALAGALAQGREALRQLHLRHLDLAEDERRTVARELHDEIGQHVAAIEMETIRVARMAPDEEVARQARLRQLRSSVAEIHRVSRRIVQRLHPPAIETLGLYTALEALFERWRDEHPEPLLCAELEGECRGLPTERAVHLYRIVQESLSNVARHAGARKVWVRVAAQADQVCVQVRDDGRGYEVLRAGRGFGLAGMRARVEALGGRLSLRSQPGTGTVVEAIVPMRELPSPGAGVRGLSTSPAPPHTEARPAAA